MVDNSFGAFGGHARQTQTLEEEDEFFSTSDRSSPLVIVIDDSLTVRNVVQFSLGRIGIQAAAFESGLAALSALSEGKVAPPKVALIDLGMDQMTGFDVMKVFRSNRALANTRVIIVSAHDGWIDRTKARVMGAYDFIAKPFQSDELVKRVCQALGLNDDAWE